VVVWTKLHPATVQLHFVLSMVLVWAAVLLLVRSGEPDSANPERDRRRSAVVPRVRGRLRRGAFWTGLAVVAGPGVDGPGLFADLSNNLVDTATLHFLLDLARECQLEARRDAMLAGAPVNLTEDRAVLHTALRAPAGSGHFPQVTEPRLVLDVLRRLAEQVGVSKPPTWRIAAVL